MNERLAQIVGAEHAVGAWAIAAIGLGSFVVLAACLALLVDPRSLPPWLRAPLPTRLRTQLTLAFVLVATLPLAALALVLPEQAARVGGLRTYGIAIAWLVASLGLAVRLAGALAARIAGPLRELESSLRRFDPEGNSELPAPAAGTPRELAAVFEHAALAGARLRRSYGQLRRSLQHGERLRADLLHGIETREQAIEQRTRQLRETHAALERLGRVDELTGLANRRSLTEFLDRTWRAALREQEPISVLMVDIDRFGAYNDSYGRDKGDACLRTVAEAIVNVAGRATDMVARLGGEEFVALLGNTPLEGALDVAEQLRAAIERLAIPHRGSRDRPMVTVSIGVASTLPVRGSKPEATLEAAERALSTAKAEGRNRVGFSTAARTGLYQSLCLPNDSRRLS